MCFQANVYSKKAIPPSGWCLLKKILLCLPVQQCGSLMCLIDCIMGFVGLLIIQKIKIISWFSGLAQIKFISTGMSSSSTVTQTTSCLDLSTCLTGVITIHVQSSKKLVRPEKKTFPEVSCSCWIYWKNYFLITELTFQPIHGTDLIRINLTPIAFRTAE